MTDIRRAVEDRDTGISDPPLPLLQFPSNSPSTAPPTSICSIIFRERLNVDYISYRITQAQI